MADDDANESRYKVKIKFRGLCPFVPGSGDAQPAWVGAFLVNAGAGNRSNFELDLPEHFPLLEYRVSELQHMQAAPQELVLSRLKFVDIAFVPPPGSQKDLRIDLAGHALEEVPKPDESNFFDWVMPMDAVTPGSGKVALECFEEDPSERLVARVHITQGLLQTEDLGQFKGQFVLAPLQVGAVQRRAVAKTVSLTIDCGPGEFRLRMRAFGDPGAPSHELVFRQPPPGELLEIGIVNLCADDLLLAAGSDLSEDQAQQEDGDFRWNYLVSEDPEDLLQDGKVPGPFEMAPIPGIDPDDGGGGVNSAQCSPPKTNPVSTQGSLAAMQALATELQA